MSCPVPQMEIIDEDDEEIKELMRRIARKEITLCEDCDTFFHTFHNESAVMNVNGNIKSSTNVK